MESKLLTLGKATFEKLFEKINVAWVLFKGNSCVSCNEAAAKLLGYTSGVEIINKHPRDMSPRIQPDGVDSAKKSLDMAEMAMQNGGHTFDWAHLKKDGSLMMVEMTLTPIEIDGENYLHAIWYDLTGHVSRFESESLVQLIEKMADPHMVYKNGLYIACNQAAIDVLGYPDKETLLRVGYENLCPPCQPDGKDSLVALAGLNQLARDNGSITSDWTFLKHDGTLINASVMATCSIVNGEEITHLLWRDLTEQIKAQEALKESEEKLQTMYDSNMEAWALWDVNSFTTCNPVCLEMYGVTSKEHFCTLHLHDIVPEKQPDGTDSLEMANELIGKAYAEGSARFEWQQQRCDTQELFYTEVSLSRVELSGKVFMQGNIRNIDDRKRAEAAQQKSEGDLRTIFESNRDAWVLMAKGEIIDANEAALRQFGYENVDTFIHTNPIDWSPPRQANGGDSSVLAQKYINTANDEGSCEFEWVIERHNTGQLVNVAVLISRVELSGRTVLQITSREITERLEMQKEIARLAFEDELTGLANRRTLLDRLTRLLVSYQRSHYNGALLFIDLDHFKRINDSLGHLVGDKLLQKVSKRLLACVRQSDTVSRFGGDEFVVMLEGLDKNMAAAINKTEQTCEKLLAHLNVPYKVGDRKSVIGASIGITMFSKDSIASELLQQSDLAMYQAKTMGRNRIRFFEPYMQKAMDEHVEIESDIKDALSNNLFELHYQLQVDSDRKVLGVEALLRLKHPEKGYIPPMKYISVAEETGLILHIGHWVLETACAQLKKWQGNEKTQHLTMAVNVSAVEFKQGSFITDIVPVIERFDINTSLLKLELTETMLVEDIDDIINKMTLLKEIGVQLSLDDFGTGYSSLRYLDKLPIDQLKIDQSFVQPIVDDTNANPIVRTIIAMGQGFGLNVIAEGVETVEQQAALLAYGCEHYQGYLYAKPMPIDELSKLLECE